jgi:hypothetical protein
MHSWRERVRRYLFQKELNPLSSELENDSEGPIVNTFPQMPYMLSFLLLQKNIRNALIKSSTEKNKVKMKFLC